MAILRRPVSARRGVKSRKARSAKTTHRYFAPKQRNINSNVGTNPGVALVHRGIGFPDKFVTNLVYNQSIVLSNFASTATLHKSMRMNSCYDPDPSVGGGQPAYFDQLAAIYARYTVRGAKLTAKFGIPNTTTVGDGPYIVGIQCGNSTSLPSTDVATLIASPNTGYAMVQAQGDSKQVTQNYSWRQLAQVQDMALGAEVNNNPTYQWYANVFASPQGTYVAGSINVLITIEYNVEFDYLKPVVDL